jgi:hypothetical protein
MVNDLLNQKSVNDVLNLITSAKAWEISFLPLKREVIIFLAES